MKRVSAVDEYKKLQYQRNFKTSNNLYTTARQNEKFYAGEQWDGINSKNLKKTVYNFVRKTMVIKNASILANELAIQRSVDDIDAGDERLDMAVKAFNLADRKNWERLQMDDMNEKLVEDASISNLGVSYWYWDNDIIEGNKYKSVGDINGQLVDMVNFYAGNPFQVDVQKQPWIKITVDMTTKELQDYAMSKGVSKTEAKKIMPDEQEITYRAFEKRDDDKQSDKEDQLATLIINFKKIDGKIYKSETTKDIVIEDWYDIDMTRYPIAIFPYKTRKSFIYAEAEPTRYIENQKMANLQIAARHLHAILMAVPKVLVNENMTGSFNNAIGSVNKVKVPPQSRIGDAMQFVQPTAMSIDVDKSVEDSINTTMDLAGVNQNIQGAARPENAAALMTQIKQASIPIETYKRRLYKYIEDVGLIWEEMYKTKYNTERYFKDDDGEFSFTGTDFANITMKTRTDVGPSTQWSEPVAYQQLMDLWNMGIITDKNAILERIPKNSFIDQDGLISDSKVADVNKQMLTLIVGAEMAEQISQMPPEEQMAMLQSLQPEQNMVQ